MQKIIIVLLIISISTTVFSQDIEIDPRMSLGYSLNSDMSHTIHYDLAYITTSMTLGRSGKYRLHEDSENIPNGAISSFYVASDIGVPFAYKKFTFIGGVGVLINKEGTWEKGGGSKWVSGNYRYNRYSGRIYGSHGYRTSSYGTWYEYASLNAYLLLSVGYKIDQNIEILISYRSTMNIIGIGINVHYLRLND